VFIYPSFFVSSSLFIPGVYFFWSEPLCWIIGFGG